MIFMVLNAIDIDLMNLDIIIFLNEDYYHIISYQYDI